MIHLLYLVAQIFLTYKRRLNILHDTKRKFLSISIKIIYPYRKWGKPKDLEVKIPAGVKGGQKIRLKGMGAPGKGGAEPGNLYLKVRIKTPFSHKIRGFLKQLGI